MSCQDDVVIISNAATTIIGLGATLQQAYDASLPPKATIVEQPNEPIIIINDTANSSNLFLQLVNNDGADGIADITIATGDPINNILQMRRYALYGLGATVVSPDTMANSPQVAFGPQVYMDADTGLIVGSNVYGVGDNIIALGDTQYVNGTNSAALATNNTIEGDNSVIAGVSSVVIGSRSNVLGYQNRIGTGSANPSGGGVGSPTFVPAMPWTANQYINDSVVMGSMNTVTNPGLAVNGVGLIAIGFNNTLTDGNRNTVIGSTVSLSAPGVAESSDNNIMAINSTFTDVNTSNLIGQTLIVGAATPSDRDNVMGNTITVNGDDTTAMGTTITTTGDYNVAIGIDAVVTGNNNVMIGRDLILTATDSVLIGPGDSAGNESIIWDGSNRSTAIGWYVWIGDSGPTAATDAVGIGSDIWAGSNSTVAIGRLAYIDLLSDNSIAIGSDASISDTSPNSISIGHIASVGLESPQSIAIGYMVDIDLQTVNSMVIGSTSFVTSSVVNSMVIGTDSDIASDYSIAIGHDNHLVSTSNQTTLIGNNNDISTGCTRAVFIGDDLSVATSDRMVAIGSGYHSTIVQQRTGTNAERGILIGTDSSIYVFATTNDNTIIGYDNLIGGNSSYTNVIIGSSNTVLSTAGAFVIGESLVGATAALDPSAITSDVSTTGTLDNRMYVKKENGIQLIGSTPIPGIAPASGPTGENVTKRTFSATTVGAVAMTVLTLNLPNQRCYGGEFNVIGGITAGGTVHGVYHLKACWSARRDGGGVAAVNLAGATDCSEPGLIGSATLAIAATATDVTISVVPTIGGDTVEWRAFTNFVELEFA